MKMSMSSAYFAIGGSARCLTCGDGDFIGMDSQTGEEETHMKFLLNIKKGAWIKMSNALTRKRKAAFDDETRLLQWRWNPPLNVRGGGQGELCEIESSAFR